MENRKRIITVSLIAAGTIFGIAGLSANTAHESSTASSTRAALEMKCGGKDHKCGADSTKTKDHKCGAKKDSTSTKKKAGDHKCGEGKCGNK